MSGRSFFTIGLILVLTGVQLRAVETFVLNRPASEFIEKQKRNSAIRDESIYSTSYVPTIGTAPKKHLTHPRWIGLAFISVGAVFLLQGLSRRTE